MRIGRLVSRKNKPGWIGLVLDWRHTGRFYPGLELKVKWTPSAIWGMPSSYIGHIQENEVEYIDETG